MRDNPRAYLICIGGASSSPRSSKRRHFHAQRSRGVPGRGRSTAVEPATEMMPAERLVRPGPFRQALYLALLARGRPRGCLAAMPRHPHCPCSRSHRASLRSTAPWRRQSCSARNVLSDRQARSPNIRKAATPTFGHARWEVSSETTTAAAWPSGRSPPITSSICRKVRRN